MASGAWSPPIASTAIRSMDRKLSAVGYQLSAFSCQRSIQSRVLRLRSE
jgi:hypothetical protein